MNNFLFDFFYLINIIMFMFMFRCSILKILNTTIKILNGRWTYK